MQSQLEQQAASDLLGPHGSSSSLSLYRRDPVRWSMREGPHPVEISGTGKLPATFSKSSKNWHIAADDVLYVDLSHSTAFVANEDRWTADVFKTGILHPQLI